MTDKEKREMIERALERFWQVGQVTHRPPIPCPYLDFDALADQAIVIECEVEHGRYEDQYKPVYDKDVTYIQGGDGGWPLHYNGHHGTPGSALAIILPLPKED